MTERARCFRCLITFRVGPPPPRAQLSRCPECGLCMWTIGAQPGHGQFGHVKKDCVIVGIEHRTALGDVSKWLSASG